MKAIVQQRYGGPEVLSLGDVPVPEPKAGEVLVRVRASSINQADWIGVTGRPFLARLAFGVFKPKRKTPGKDLAGTVEAIGPGVTQFQVGDHVFGEIDGAYTEYACGKEAQLWLKPENLTFEQSAAIPLAGLTALHGMREKCQAAPGRHILINGASGGVGTFAIQIGKALGAEITAVCSTGNVETARELGADRVIDYRQEDFTAGGVRYDAILDIAGSKPVAACRKLLAPGGKYVFAGGGMGPLFRAMVASVTSKDVVTLLSLVKQDDLAVLKTMAEAGQIAPVIEHTYSLAEVPEALRAHGRGHAKGKRVIEVA